ncbi:MAG: trigger factor [Clostridia bacterium]|nr:trigger factor [Clostridia bacterium]
MYCPKCQKDLPADSTFCPYCGNEKLTEKAETAEEQAAIETQTAAVPASEAEPAAPKKSGKGVVIGLLCVLVVLAAIAAAFAIGSYIGRGNAPAETGTTDMAQTGEPVDEDLFPDEYTTAYPDGFDYASADLSKHVTLGKYKGVTVTLTLSSEITDADVQSYIQEMMTYYATEQDVTDRSAALGDTVVIDFVGTMDGVAFSGGTADDQTLILGEGGYIDGFEDGIVGMNIGETKTIDVTFPESYQNADLAGKPAKFEITLDSIKESVAPEYNDTFVREELEYDTMAEFEAEVKEMLKAYRADEILAEKQDGAFSIAVDNATIVSYPEGVVEDYMYQQISYVKSYAEMYSMTYSDFTEQVIGMTAAEYEAEVRASAEAAVKQEMVLYAIAQAENISGSEEERKAAEEYYLSYYGAEDVASMCDSLDVTVEYFNNMIDFSVIYTAVMDFLTENATYAGAK